MGQKEYEQMSAVLSSTYQDNLLPEEIYTSYQWFTVLDTVSNLIFEALLEDTSLVEYYVSQLLVFQHSNKRKDVSLEHKWRPCISHMSLFLADPTLSHFINIKLDRGYTQAMISNFLDLTRGYMQTYTRAFHSGIEGRVGSHYGILDEYHLRVGLKNNKDMVQLISAVDHLFTEYRGVRDQIIKNYYKFINNKSITDANNIFQGNVDRDDLHQNYFMAANKAVNHFNKDRGTFKSYLELWLRKVKLSERSMVTPWGHSEMGDAASFLGEEEDSLTEGMVNNSHAASNMLKMSLVVDPSGHLAKHLGIHNTL